MIEVPDPESKIPKLLGRYWMPFFQPQHLLSPKHIERFLRQGGWSNAFRVVAREDG